MRPPEEEIRLLVAEWIKKAVRLRPWTLGSALAGPPS